MNHLKLHNTVIKQISITLKLTWEGMEGKDLKYESTIIMWIHNYMEN